MEQLDKHLHIISAPDSGPNYPVWPGYVAPYTYQQAVDRIRALVDDKDTSYDEMKDGLFELVFDILTIYDAALSKAQRDLWACEGMRGNVVS